MPLFTFLYTVKQPITLFGVIHTKWLMRELKAVNGDTSWINLEGIASDHGFIPDTTVLYDQLRAFRERSEHFAFIVDGMDHLRALWPLRIFLEENRRRDYRWSMICILTVFVFNPWGLIWSMECWPFVIYATNWIGLPDDEYSTVLGVVAVWNPSSSQGRAKFKFHEFQFEVVRPT